jgi:hypothetical protein
VQWPSNAQTPKSNRHRKEVEFYGQVQQQHLGRAFTKGRLYSIAVTDYDERGFTTTKQDLNPRYALSSAGRLRIFNK